MAEEKRKAARVVRVSEIIEQLRRFKTRDLLAKASFSLQELGRTSTPPYSVKRRARRGLRTVEEEVFFTPWALSFLAKYSILASNDLRSREITGDDLFQLVGLFSLLEDPFMEDGDSSVEAYRFLLRTSWEQFSLQESLKVLIPRYYALLRLMNDIDNEPVIDVPAVWRSMTGITLEDFMVLGFAAWAFGGSHPICRTRGFEETGVESIAKRATKENMEAFFGLTMADYERFKVESKRFALADMRYAKTEFNVLRKYPLIEPRRHEFIAPVPQLILETTTRGIYHDLLTAHAGGRRNAFLEQFGRSFELYVGELLKRAYGEDRVIPEPRYGRPEKRGPDWILIEGDVAVLLECTVSGTRLETRSLAEVRDVTTDARKVYADRIRKFPGKIEDLQAGRVGVDMSGVRRYIPIVVTHEALYIEPVTRLFIAEEIGNEVLDRSGVLLIDVGDVEVITGWGSRCSFSGVLDEWQAAYKKEAQSLSAFLPRKCANDELSWGNPWLREIQDSFLEMEGLPPPPEVGASN